MQTKIVPLAVLMDPSYRMFSPDTRVTPHPEPDGDEDAEEAEEDASREEALDQLIAQFYANLVGHAAAPTP